MIVADRTAAEVSELRRGIFHGLERNEIHVWNVLREPTWFMEAVVVGDILCCCVGLDEATVTRLLKTVGVNWGRRLALLRKRERERLLYLVKTRHPETWERWKESVG